ncbi:MAG: hypothetical protein ACUVQG_00385 [Thermogutta sp.]
MGRRRPRGKSGPEASLSHPQASPQDFSDSRRISEPSADQGPSQELASPPFAAAADRICSIAHEELLQQQSREAIAARAFLQTQGLAWSAIGHLPLGIVGDVSNYRREYFQRQMGPEEAVNYWLGDARLNRVLIGPIRDADGKLVTLWARSIEPGRAALLYRHPWQERVGVFGRECLATVKANLLFAVERILDALILRSHGIEPVVAFGRRFDQVPAESWAALCAGQFPAVVLLPAGYHVSASIFRAVRVQVERLISPPEIWVVPPKRMFAPLGRMAAILKSPEFAEYVCDRGVALLGRKRTIHLVEPGAAKARPRPGSAENPEKGPRAGNSPQIRGQLKVDLGRNVDWLAFD